MLRQRTVFVGLLIALGLCVCGCTVQVAGTGGGSSKVDDEQNGPPPADDGQDGAPETVTPDDDQGVTPNGGEPVVPDNLEAGRSNQTLEAAERKRFRLTVNSGETVILNTSLPDSRTDVDMYVYAPGGDQPIASAEGGPGRSANLTFTAEQTGTYTVEVVNISAAETASLSLDVQRILPRESSSSLVNGVYEITQRDGMTAGASRESWVFSNGKFTSLYGVLSAEDLRAAGVDVDQDVHYWVDATTGEACELHVAEYDISWRIVNPQTEQQDSTLTVVFDQLVSSAGPDGPVQSQQTISLDSVVVDDGRILRGSYGWIIDNDPSMSYEGSVTMELKQDAGND